MTRLHRHLIGLLIGLLAMLSLLAACSTTGNSEPKPVDRIVVATNVGEIYVVDAAGQDRLDLSEAGSVGLYPVWAPDGGRIAWSQRDGFDFSIVSTNPDGTARQQATTRFSGYFGYWNPTSTTLGFLGNAPPGTGLVLDEGEGGDLRVVDSDTFYYFSWNPEGTRWVVHSGSGLHIMSVDGSRQDLDLTDAQFRAPVWAPDGQILLAIVNAGRNVIVSFDPDTGVFKELLEVGDIANFVLDPSGRFLAVESIELGDGDDPDFGQGVTVAFQQASVPRADVLVYDMESGDTVQVYDGRSGGFWWSPNGESLAVLVPEDGAQASFAQWLVWSSQGDFRTDLFRPGQAYVQSYVPFFDQYAQAVSPWAPDSTRFVYSGSDVDGRSGVFVQAAEPNTPAVMIVDEPATAFWSPT